MCKILTKIVKLYGSWRSIFETNLPDFSKTLEPCLNFWDFALLNKYYQITKQSVHLGQFYFNRLNLLNVWLVSDQGPLVLELRTLPLSNVELHKLFPYFLSPTEGNLKIMSTTKQ